jgi:hypothetical protein
MAELLLSDKYGTAVCPTLPTLMSMVSLAPATAELSQSPRSIHEAADLGVLTTSLEEESGRHVGYT